MWKDLDNTKRRKTPFTVPDSLPVNGVEINKSMLKESIRKRILGPVHIHLDVTARFTNQILTIYPIISTQSSIENYAKMRFESRRLSPYLFTCDVTHSLSVESHLQAFVLHFILSIKFAERKKRNKKRKRCHLSQGSRGRRTRRPGTSKSGLRHRVFLSGDSRVQVVFTAILPNIYLCFFVYEPKSILEISIRVYYAPL